jgi:hypothetical protein
VPARRLVRRPPGGRLTPVVECCCRVVTALRSSDAARSRACREVTHGVPTRVHAPSFPCRAQAGCAAKRSPGSVARVAPSDPGLRSFLAAHLACGECAGAERTHSALRGATKTHRAQQGATLCGTNPPAGRATGCGSTRAGKCRVDARSMCQMCGNVPRCAQMCPNVPCSERARAGAERTQFFAAARVRICGAGQDIRALVLLGCGLPRRNASGGFRKCRRPCRLWGE